MHVHTSSVRSGALLTLGSIVSNLREKLEEFFYVAEEKVEKCQISAC